MDVNSYCWRDRFFIGDKPITLKMKCTKCGEQILSLTKEGEKFLEELGYSKTSLNSSFTTDCYDDDCKIKPRIYKDNQCLSTVCKDRKCSPS